MGSGISELGDHLGPLLRQFARTKKFDPVDLGAFLSLLPSERDGIPLQHAVEVRHESFVTPDFATLCNKYNVAIVYADHATYPDMADVTSTFVYARLQTGQDNIPTAYSPEDLDKWAENCRVWAKGGIPDGLTQADPNRQPSTAPRDVYVYFIHEGKIRAPHAAMALQKMPG